MTDMCFNSKLVRLKDTGVFYRMPTRAMFQFQTGAIKSAAAGEGRVVHFRCFNSKLVRLKVGGKSYAASRIVCFNSKLVRLKGVSARPLCAAGGGFNSKLVRLKGKPIYIQKVLEITSFNSKLVRLKG